MPRYSPRTHVFSYGGITPKVRRERHTLDSFCKQMRTRHGASYRMLRISRATRCGLVVNLDGATVDGVLRTSSGAVAVELLGYSPLSDRGDVMARDMELRKKIKHTLYDRLKKRCYSISLGYRERLRSKPNLGTVRTVPRYPDFQAVTKELGKIVTDAPSLDFNQFLSILFVKPAIVKRCVSREGTLYLDETCFPNCATYLNCVRLQGLKDFLTPQVDSELSCGWIGIDEEWLRKHLADKANKSLHSSRERANGLPLWLIVHSDGYAIHQTIHETHRRRAIEICRQVLAATEHGFARVYWADGTAFLDAAWVGRVM